MNSSKTRALSGVMVAGIGLVALASPRAVDADEGSSLHIDVTGLHSSDGKVLCSLFRAPDGFPGNHRQAHRTATVSIRSGHASIAFEGLAPGEYAIAVFHDENGNRHLDTSIIGAPTEGWGVSRNPAPKLRAPRWSEASFRLERDERRPVVVKIRYP